MATVVGVFETREQASDTVRALIANDVSSEAISVITPSDVEPAAMDAQAREKEVAAGAGTGAVIGGLGGLLVGLATLAIPGVGPVLAAGPIAAALAGLGVGVAAGTIVGAMTEVGIPEREAGHYAEALRRGATLVVVTADEPLADRVVEIMNQHRAVDVDEWAEEWRRTGWEGFDEDSIRPCTTEDLRRERDRLCLERQRSAGGARAFTRDVTEAARHFGRDMATNLHYGHAGWAVVEPEAHRQWEERQPGTWDRCRDIICEAWNEVRGRQAA